MPASKGSSRSFGLLGRGKTSRQARAQGGTGPGAARRQGRCTTGGSTPQPPGSSWTASPSAVTRSSCTLPAAWHVMPSFPAVPPSLRGFVRERPVLPAPQATHQGGNGRVGPCGGLAARNVVRHYHALLARAGLARRPFHHLRHTAAGWLLAEGADLRVVQQVLGHSQLALTANLYVHVMPTLLREAAYGRAAGRGPLANWHPNWHQPAGPGRRRAAQRHKRRCALSGFGGMTGKSGAGPGRFELPTRGLEVRRSVQLSYGPIFTTRSVPNCGLLRRCGARSTGENPEVQRAAARRLPCSGACRSSSVRLPAPAPPALQRPANH